VHVLFVDRCRDTRHTPLPRITEWFKLTREQLMFLKTFPSKTTQDNGLDCVICAEFARVGDPVGREVLHERLLVVDRCRDTRHTPLPIDNFMF